MVKLERSRLVREPQPANIDCMPVAFEALKFENFTSTRDSHPANIEFVLSKLLASKPERSSVDNALHS